MSQLILQETAVEWKTIYNSFYHHVLCKEFTDHTILSNLSNVETFMKAFEFIRNQYELQKGDCFVDDDENIQLCYNCIRLLIRRGMIHVTLTNDIINSDLKRHMHSLIEYSVYFLNLYQRINKRNKSHSNCCIEILKCLIIIFGKEPQHILLFNRLQGVNILCQLLENKNCSVSMLFQLVRMFHFLEIKHSDILQSEVKVLDMVDRMLCLIYKTCAGHLTPPPTGMVNNLHVQSQLPVTEAKESMITEILRYLYAMVGNHGSSIFNNRDPIVSYGQSCTGVHSAQADTEASTISIWDYNHNILVHTLTVMFTNLPSRHPVIYKYKLQIVQVLMLTPVQHIMRSVMSNSSFLMELCFILQMQLEAVWDMDTDAGINESKDSESEAHIQEVLVMGYHSDKSTILLMPICAVLTNICTFCKEQGDQPKGMDPIDQKFAVLKKTLVDLILCKEDDAYVIRNPMEETALVYKTGVEVDLKEALGTMKPSERNVKPYYISGKLITLLTSLNTLLKRCSGELLYVLCDNDDDAFVGQVGYGSAIGLLQVKKGLGQVMG